MESVITEVSLTTFAKGGTAIVTATISRPNRVYFTSIYWERRR